MTGQMGGFGRKTGETNEPTEGIDKNLLGEKTAFAKNTDLNVQSYEQGVFKVFK